MARAKPTAPRAMIRSRSRRPRFLIADSTAGCCRGIPTYSSSLARPFGLVEVALLRQLAAVEQLVNAHPVRGAVRAAVEAHRAEVGEA